MDKSQPPPVGTHFYVLGFDYGRRKIGVAVGQTLTAHATPVGILPLHQGQPQWARIEALIKEWHPAHLLVGVPWRSDGSDSHSIQAAQRFIHQLQQRFHLPVRSVNEYLSSYEARLRATKDEAVDAWAAQVIVETWLSEYIHE
jgi:putative holliday junction resolvase